MCYLFQDDTNRCMIGLFLAIIKESNIWMALLCKLK